MQQNLLYPNKPGFKAKGTSEEASDSMQSTAKTLRESSLRALQGSKGLTADEVASTLSQSILAIRPRLSELKLKGLIKDSGLRRKNHSGRNAVVWIIDEDIDLTPCKDCAGVESIFIVNDESICDKCFDVRVREAKTC